MSSPAKPNSASTGVAWPLSRWQRPVNRARRLLPVAAGAGLVVLAAAAIALNVRTDGGNMIDILAGMSIPIGIGLLAAIVIAELRVRGGR